MPLPPLPSLLPIQIPRVARRVAPPLALTPEEEESLLGRAMGFLQYAGETLDKPGAALRGLMAGEPEQLLNLIPFSDTLGITDPKERIYGRELLEKVGIAPPNTPGLDPWDVAGFLTEVGLDPLTFVTGPTRALTVKGLAAQGKTVEKLADVVGHVTGAGKKGGFRILGTTPKAVAEEIRAGERGLMALKVPFAKEPFAVFGAGSEKAGSFIEALNYGRISPIRAARYLWSKKVGGIWDPMEQKAADAAFSQLQNVAGAVKNVSPIFGRELGKLHDRYGEIAEHFKRAGDPHATGDFLEFQRFAAEKASELDATTRISVDEIANLFESGNPAAVQEFSSRFHRVLDSMSQIKDYNYARFRELGGRGEWLDDAYALQFPRRPSNKAAAKAWDEQMARRLLPTGFPFSSARRDVLKNIPEGTYTLNRMARDELVTATGKGAEAKRLRKVVAAELEEKMGRAPSPARIKAELKKRGLKERMPEAKTLLEAELSEMGVAVDEAATLADMQRDYLFHKYLRPAALRSGIADGTDEMRRLHLGYDQIDDASELSKSAINAMVEKGWKYDETAKTLTMSHPSVAGTLSDYLRNLPEEILRSGLFDRSLVDDWMDYAEHLAVSTAGLHTIHNVLRAAVKAERADDMVPLKTAWEMVQSKEGRQLLHQRGLDTFVATERGIQKTTRLVKDLDADTIAALKKRGWEERPGGILEGYDPKLIDDALGDMMVDGRIPEVLGKYVEVMQPKAAGAIGQIYDNITNATKQGLTLFWPAFHVRNYVDGQWRNWAGLPKVSTGTYFWATRNANKFLREGVGEFGDEVKLLDLQLTRGGRLEDIAGEGVEAATSGTFWEIFSPMRLGRIAEQEPWVSKVKTPQQLLKAMRDTGERAYAWVEYQNRVPAYMALRKSGYAPAEAKHLVDQIQYDYALRGKGRNVHYAVQRGMRRLVPFWGFMSNNLPYQFSQLLNAPGGRTAQTIRFINTLRREGGGYLPQWLRERTAIRLPGTEDKEAVFLRKFGLSIEDLSNITFAGGLLDPIRTGERYFSQTHPILTTAYKFGADRDPYSGRELKYMEPVTGMDWFDTLLMGTPVSRAVRTGQEAAYLVPGREKKKPWPYVLLDLLTGAQVGSYDLPRQKLFELQEAWQEEMRQMPEIGELKKLYISKRGREKASPERIAELEKKLAQQRSLDQAIRQLLAQRNKEK